MTRAVSKDAIQDKRGGIVACIPAMRVVAWVLTGHRQHADDLVHDAIIQALAVETPCQPGMNLRVRLFAILHDLHKARMGIGSYGDTTRQDMGPGHEINPEFGDFHRAFWQLGDRHREMLILVGVSGLSHAEAATVCGCPLDTFESQMSQARVALLATQHRNPVADKPRAHHRAAAASTARLKAYCPID